MTERKLTVGLCQMNGSDDPAHNLHQIESLIREAHQRGATFITTPEVTNFISQTAKQLYQHIQEEANDPTLHHLQSLAKTLNIWLLIGSLALKHSNGNACNRSLLLAPNGEIYARYDKIHMFCADLPNGENYDEGKHYQAGKDAVLAHTDIGKIGMSICYDLRFPHLYRQLAQAGADILTVPAAFTVPTGRAHWHILLRARAIETGCFVIAPSQWGKHGNGEQGGLRRSYGYSLIVAPWGEILADCQEGIGVSIAEINLAEVAYARSRIPALTGDQNFQLNTKDPCI